MIRLFLGIPVAGTELLALQQGLQTGAKGVLRSTPADNFHCTVVFIGEVTPEVLTDIRYRLRQMPPIAAFTLQFTHVTAVARRRQKAGHIWVEAEPSRGFAAVVLQSRAVLADYLPPTRRPQIPHITLASFKGECPELPSLTPFALTAARLCLYQSFLGGRAPRYTILETYPLAGGRS